MKCTCIISLLFGLLQFATLAQTTDSTIVSDSVRVMPDKRAADLQTPSVLVGFNVVEPLMQLFNTNQNFKTNLYAGKITINFTPLLYTDFGFGLENYSLKQRDQLSQYENKGVFFRAIVGGQLRSQYFRIGLGVNYTKMYHSGIISIGGDYFTPEQNYFESKVTSMAIVSQSGSKVKLHEYFMLDVEMNVFLGFWKSNNISEFEKGYAFPGFGYGGFSTGIKPNTILLGINFAVHIMFLIPN